MARAVLTINATTMYAKARPSNRLAKANRTAAPGPRVRAREKVEKTRKNPKDILKSVEGAKHSNKGKGSTKGLAGLEQSKLEANSESHESEQTDPTETPYTDSPGC